MDFDVILQKNTSAQEINALFKDACANGLHGILGVDEDYRVSQDFLECSYSSVVALDLTQVIGGNLVKVMSWYDNEWGYANRLLDMAKFITKE